MAGNCVRPRLFEPILPGEAELRRSALPDWPSQFENFPPRFFPPFKNSAAPSSTRPINDAAKLVNWPLNWRCARCFRCLVAHRRSSLPPRPPPPDITIPPCHIGLGSVPQTGRCFRRGPPHPQTNTLHPTHTVSASSPLPLPPPPPALSRCFMSASQQVGGEREAGMMASLAA